MNITITSNPSSEDNNVILAGIQNYNKHYIAESVQPLSVYSRTNDDVIVGGLVGSVFGNWLHIRELWVSEEYRGKSIGAKFSKLPRRKHANLAALEQRWTPIASNPWIFI